MKNDVLSLKQRIFTENSFKSEGEDDNFVNNTQTARELFGHALLNYHFHDYRVASYYFEKSLELAPDQSEVLYFYALSLAALGKYEKSIDIINRAIRMDSGDERFWHDKGVNLLALNRYHEADRCFNKAIKINPNNSITWQNKGLLFFEMEKFEKAIDYYEKSIETDSTNIQAILGLANVYIYLNDETNIKKYLRMAKTIDKNNIHYLTEQGKYFLLTDEFDEAIECFNKCLRRNGDLPTVLMFKALALSGLGFFDLMHECIEKAVRLDSSVLEEFGEFFEI